MSSDPSRVLQEATLWLRQHGTTGLAPLSVSRVKELIQALIASLEAQQETITTLTARLEQNDLLEAELKEQAEQRAEQAEAQLREIVQWIQTERCLWLWDQPQLEFVDQIIQRLVTLAAEESR